MYTRRSRAIPTGALPTIFTLAKHNMSDLEGQVVKNRRNDPDIDRLLAEVEKEGVTLIREAMRLTQVTRMIPPRLNPAARKRFGLQAPASIQDLTYDEACYIDAYMRLQQARDRLFEFCGLGSGSKLELRDKVEPQQKSFRGLDTKGFTFEFYPV